MMPRREQSRLRDGRLSQRAVDTLARIHDAGAVDRGRARPIGLLGLHRDDAPFLTSLRRLGLLCAFYGPDRTFRYWLSEAGLLQVVKRRAATAALVAVIAGGDLHG